jgi:hypothetical protein
MKEASATKSTYWRSSTDRWGRASSGNCRYTTPILHLLTNPIYAGAYAFGRTCSRVTVREGRKRVVRGYRRAQTKWEVLLSPSPRGVHLVGGVREEPPDRRQCP